MLAVERARRIASPLCSPHATGHSEAHIHLSRRLQIIHLFRARFRQGALWDELSTARRPRYRLLGGSQSRRRPARAHHRALPILLPITFSAPLPFSSRRPTSKRTSAAPRSHKEFLPSAERRSSPCSARPTRRRLFYVLRTRASAQPSGMRCLFATTCRRWRQNFADYSVRCPMSPHRSEQIAREQTELETMLMKGVAGFE
jgi:hypothetical protein